LVGVYFMSHQKTCRRFFGCPIARRSTVMSPVTKISRVLVGVDFDDASASALKMAGVLATAWDADITVFHAATQEMPAYFTAAQIVVLEAEREQGQAVTADQIRLFSEQHVARAVRVVVGEGPPQDGMLGMAASFDLIVVGTHRRHGARRWWLGSVAEAVVRHSPRPVLVVPAAAVVPDPRRAPTILVAGGDGAADAWVDVLSTTFGGNVVRQADIHQCAPDRVQNADVIVLSMPADVGAHAQFGAIVQVLRECVHPVLFVPSANGIFERSPS
jgi:nucleotide-binding universal stress UspA family protein